MIREYLTALTYAGRFCRGYGSPGANIGRHLSLIAVWCLLSCWLESGRITEACSRETSPSRIPNTCLAFPHFEGNSMSLDYRKRMDLQ